jgi:hypothetical protein
MSKRFALLVGSTVPIDDSMKPIPKEIRNTNLEAMAEKLSSLGTHRFTWSDEDKRDDSNLMPKILHNPDRSRLLSVISGVSSDHHSDVFLLYYFGHGFVGNDGDLILALKGIDIARNKGGFSLNWVVDEILARGFSKLVIIIDCCHAGLAARGLAVSARKAAYYLMASSGGGRSYFDAYGGDFTQALVGALSYPNAEALRDIPRKAVTFEKWFDVAKGLVSSQVPFSDGQLGTEALYPYETSLPSAVNRLAPPKSVYSKIYLLLELIGSNIVSLEEVCRRIRSRELYAFQVATVTEEGQIERRFVLPSKIREYLDLITDLGLGTRDKAAAKNETHWELTARGTRAIANDGSSFNAALIDAVSRWLPEGVTADTINDILFSLVTRATLPKVLYVEQSLLERSLPIMNRRKMRIALQLLSYAGVIQRATSDTFFPR